MVETIDHLIGMQAQNPLDPYFGLWARLDDFDPIELSRLIVDRKVVRASWLRATIHLVTASDYIETFPALQSVPLRTFGSTQFAKDTEGIDRNALLEVGRSLLEERPRTRAELGPLLSEHWPERVSSSLAYAVTYLMPLVQVPPRGVWGRTGPSAWTPAEHWLGRRLAPAPPVDGLILRYLAAFGPAAVKDIRVWSGLGGLADVVRRLRSQLLTFRDESGSELFDLPEAPRPDPDAPAPPRFLPEYDNTLLSHSDRSRFFEAGIVPKGWVGNLLFDGFFSGSWKVERSRDAVHLNVMLGKKLPKRSIGEIVVEAERLLGFTDPGIEDRSVRVVNDWR